MEISNSIIIITSRAECYTLISRESIKASLWSISLLSGAIIGTICRGRVRLINSQSSFTEIESTVKIRDHISSRNITSSTSVTCVNSRRSLAYSRAISSTYSITNSCSTLGTRSTLLKIRRTVVTPNTSDGRERRIRALFTASCLIASQWAIVCVGNITLVNERTATSSSVRTTRE